MNDDAAGVIRIFTGKYIPAGYLACTGTTFPISTYPELFAAIGNRYGGDGVTNFAVPNYQGEILIGAGQGPGLTNRVLGAAGGSGGVVLNQVNLPMHNHSFNVSSASATTNAPAGNTLAGMNYISGRQSPPAAAYGTGLPNTPIGTNTLSPWPTNPSTQPHSNMMPFQIFNFIISTGTNN